MVFILSDDFYAVQGVTDSDDSIFVTGDFSQNIRLWVLNFENNSLKCAAICKGHKDTVTSLASTASISGCRANIFASASSDATIKIWSASMFTLNRKPFV